MSGSEEDPDQRASQAAADPPPRLAENEFYRALASSHRRRLLYYLLENGDSTVEEVATVLTGWNATTSGTMQTPRDRSAVRLQLVHDHLPRLADWGLIDYDAAASTVHLASLHQQVEAIIKQSIEAEQRTETG